MDIQVKELHRIDALDRGAPVDSLILRQGRRESLIGSTVVTMLHLLPNFMLPGFAMLAGGLVLFFSGRMRGLRDVGIPGDGGRA